MVGSSYTFFVTASGTGPLSYQWRRDGANLVGQNSPSLPLSGIQTNDAGVYTVVVSNVEGAITSAPAPLTVRLASDPVYPLPQGGWNYVFQGNSANGSPSAGLDGTWARDSASDSWDGLGRGPVTGAPGGVATTNGILTIEDTVIGGTGFNNRRFYFTHNLAQETGVTNAASLIDDGVTLTFRARLTPPSDPLVELTNAPNGLVNYSDGKGMFGIRQAGSDGLLVSFSLNNAVEDTSSSTSHNFGQAGLHMNTLNGDLRSAAVDPGEGGAPNVLPFDPALFHEFWITITANGADPGTHRVSVYLDGNKTPTIFNVTAGTGYDGLTNSNYLALGLGSSLQRGGVDVDFFGYRAGAAPPSGFNEPVGFTQQPVSQYVAEGLSASFNVGVTGTPPYGFQWYRNGAAIPGATNSVYHTPPVTPGDEGAQFTVVVNNEFNSITSAPPALLHLLAAPVITTQPASLTVTNGDTAIFSVAVSSQVTPTYQWYFNPSGPPASRPAGPQAGETNATLTIGSAHASDAGTYWVVVSNNSGSVTSALATLSVILFDYGDAPDPTFATLKANNGARHLIVSGIHLGASIDADVDGQPGAGATGDDANGNDEDGVIFATPLLAGQVASVQVTATTNGFLNTWLDFDRNGSWNGAGEQVFTNTPLTAGINNLQLIVPGAASSGVAYARFRFNSVGGLSFAGLAPDGEVEDYARTILPVADLRVTQTAMPNPVAVNGNLTCFISISNAGPSGAGSVVTTNGLPAGASFVSAFSSQGSCIFFGGQVTCDLGSMSNGGTATMALVLQPLAIGTITNTVQVSSTAADLAPANNTATATATALEPPAITTQPQSLTVTNGSPATFTVAASGMPPLSFQWRRNGVDLAGKTNTSLTITSAQPADVGNYTVRVSNQVGFADSQVATLTVLGPPSIIEQPQSRTNLAGSMAIFNVSGAGTEPLAYQWRFNGGNIIGATTPWLVLSDVQLSNAGPYRVVLSNVAGVTTSAVATLTVIAMDFGDAPDSYQTLLTNNGARHRLIAGIRLGASEDFEPDGQPDDSANGDDLNGSDDDDGVFWNTPLRVGQTVSVSVVASTNGLLNAWLDFDRSGSWGEPGEQVFTNRSLATGTNNLSFTVPAGANPGTSFGRFRFSTVAGLSFIGEAPNGEVEDCLVTIEGVADVAVTRVGQTNIVAAGSDQTYSITISNAGPSAATGVTATDVLPPAFSFVSAQGSQGECAHSAGIVTCSLGDLGVSSNVTVTIVAIPTAPGNATNSVSVTANQVDLNPANNTLAVVSSVLEPPHIKVPPLSQIVTNGGTATFSVSAGGTALRYQWHLNGSEVASATNSTLTIINAQPVHAGAYTVRVTNEIGSAISGAATLTVLVPVSITIDPQSQTVLSGTTVILNVTATGSAPITYQWEFDGADLPGQTGSSLVLSGVQTNHSGAYRVRVTNPIRTVISAIATLTVFQRPVFIEQPESSTNVAGGTVLLSALAVGTAPTRYQWYFNQISPLADQTNTTLIFTNVQANRSGAYTVVATNIAGATTSAVAVLTVYEMDFGDAPESSGYPTTTAFNGARHRLLPGVRLGALADFETNGLSSAAATGDDTSGVDDEDGVTFPFPLLVGQPATAVVVASTNGLLDAWIDFDGNGAWGDPGEQILASRAITTGTNNVIFGIPPSAVASNRFARFRFSTTGGLSYDGFAPDGEVEDHQVSIRAAIDLTVGMEQYAITNSEGGITNAPFPSTGIVEVSSNFVYIMSVTNRGPSTAAAVTLTNLLPPSIAFVQARPSQGFCGVIGSGLVFCPVGSIPSGGVVTMELRVQATAPGTFVNTAFASAGATETELTPADNSVAETTTVVLPAAYFSNLTPIPVADATPAGPGKGNPYPSTILVSGLTGAVQSVKVTLNNLSHPFSKDFDILLVGPSGQSVVLMSDAGGSSLNAVTLTFDDAAELALPNAGVIVGGTYQPSNYGTGMDVFPSPAPAGPYGNTLSAFTGTDPTGVWSLYVADGTMVGSGSIGAGWQLGIITADPIADVAVSAVGSPSPVAVNSNLVYNLTVTNNGPAVLSSLTLTNILPAGVTFVSVTSTLGSCAQLAGVVTCVVSNLNPGVGAAATITIRPTSVGMLTNTVRALGNRLDVRPSNNFVQTVVAARPVTDLSVSQVASTNSALPGELLTYTLDVTNRGPNPATNVRLTDVLPGTVTFLAASATQGGCTNAGGTVTCNLNALAVGARAQVTFLVQPTAVGLITNSVQVASDEVDSAGTNNTMTVVTSINVPADLAVSIVDSPDPVAVSNVLTYAITVTNRGPNLATAVQLTNALPPNVSVVSMNAGPASCTNDNGIVRCLLGALPTNASAVVTLSVAPSTAGRLTNSVGVRTDSIDATASNNVAVVVTDAAWPPVIVTQPESRTVTNGANVIFTVNASGTGPLRYQWQFNGADVAGATNVSLSLSNLAVTAAGSYRVRVSNILGQTFSAPATLMVLAAPVISNILDQQTDEDITTPEIPFVINDADTPLADLNLSALSTDLTLVPLTNIVFAGTGSSRTVQIRPAPNRFGSATITVQVRDGSGLQASDVFLLTVRPINDPPTVSDIPDQSALEDATVSIPFGVDDVESLPDALDIRVTSSNTNLLTTTNIVVTGIGTNRLMTVRPSTNQSGSVTITVTVTDTNAVSATDEFVLTVTAVNDPPTLDAPGGLTIIEDAGLRVVPLMGIGPGASNELQSLTIIATSDNPALIPDPVVAYVSGETNGSLSFAPLLNAHGVATIRVTVDDGGTSNNVIVRTFTVTVQSTNDLPQLSTISDLTIDENTMSPSISFSVTDVESAVESVTVLPSSSNPGVVPANNVVITGTGTNRSLVVTPATNQFGVTLISLTATDTDGGATVGRFQVTVRQTSVPPAIISPPESRTVTNGATVAFSVTANGTLPISFQWKRNGSDLFGQTNTTLTITNAQAVDAGSYSVMASNRAGSVTSPAATLRVLVSPLITAIVRTGATAQISFSSEPGLSYTVEFTDAPEAPGWNPLPTVIGTGASMTVTDSAATAPSRIYRIRVE